MEDLWPFNEEAVARAIAGSRLPIVSAVGHESDFTIADFVADTGPTPLQRLNCSSPDVTELAPESISLEARLLRAQRQNINLMRPGDSTSSSLEIPLSALTGAKAVPQCLTL